jgi:hypothetical protein
MLKVSPSTSVSLPSSVCAITAGVLLVAAAVSSLPLALIDWRDVERHAVGVSIKAAGRVCTAEREAL